MLRNMLSSKLVRAGLIGCILLIAGSLLYHRHVVGPIRKKEERTQQFLREFEAKIAAAEKTDADTAKQPATPIATYPIPETVPEAVAEAPKPLLTEKAAPVATAAAPKTPVPEKEIVDIPVSPYGFGPYPELPDEISPALLPAPSAKYELLLRVRIKLLSQGINAEGTVMKDGLVYPIIKGILYVKWGEFSPDGYRYIKNSTGHLDDGLRLRTIRWEKRGNLTEVDMPPDITLISYEEGGINPYEFLGLPQRD